MSELRPSEYSTVAVLDLSDPLTVEAGVGTLGKLVDTLLELNCANIVLNLRQVKRVDCAGIGELVGCYKKTRDRGITLRLLQVNPRIHCLLRLFHLETVLKETSPQLVSAAPTGFTAAPGELDCDNSARETVAMPFAVAPGDTVTHYRLKEKIGEGGMGVVYRAEDVQLEREVALKFLKPEALNNCDLKYRFLCEAKAAAALDHPNVCTVHELGEVAGQLFLAMSYVDGESLAKRIRQQRMPVDLAIEIAIQVADGLGAAHRKGIVHRDIKPDNIMLDTRGRVKITDFGIAHLQNRNDRLTRVGTVMGTPAYMSPEQKSGCTVDNRTDVWALGVLLYEVVGGELPYSSPENGKGTLKPLSSLRPEAPPGLDRIIAKALERNPDSRHQRIGDLAGDLRRLRLGFSSAGTEYAEIPHPIPPPDAAAGSA